MSHETQMLLGLFLGIAIMIFLVMKTKTHTVYRAAACCTDHRSDRQNVPV